MNKSPLIDRRSALSLAAWALAAPSALLAQEDDWRIVLERSIAKGDSLTLGRIVPPPDDASWKEVDALISKAPAPTAHERRPTPFEVAEYLVSAVPPKFTMAWPEPNPAHPTYANPMILRFFLSTHTHPEGDETAWCAAFVNWCLERAEIPGTGSASSQSFLNWGKPVWQAGDSEMPDAARCGDIAVFQLRYDRRRGHVCFFRSISDTSASSVEVVGGNQLTGPRRARRHLIDVDTFRVDGELQLKSVLTMPGLRRA